ncbi:ketopantoate reductase family protein [Paludifilum halophilum]|uniref:2-dehydropantoate 2-reductase n=1 Tax=Paludifilum halophilum TaxID=1642702 RepID=A0A235B6C4_9BACL|nr:2-dehydropantoate 2-reductase [Paludifilum halophilum]OYD07843.1 hypothetical protein CHM34_10360 [Paludifilum halophilum]
MRIAVWGAGAVGLLWSVRLFREYPELRLITRTKEQRDRIEEEGVRFTGLDGRTETFRIPVCWAEQVSGPFDLMLVTVKQTDLPGVARRFGAICSPSVPVLLWQNGMEHEECWRREGGGGALYRAVNTEGALRRDSIHVCQTGSGKAWVGPFSETVPSPALKRWVEQCSNRGFPILFTREIDTRAWEKLAVNSVINPLTALLGITNGRLTAWDSFPPLMEAILEETAGVAAHAGVTLDVRELREKVLQVCEQTASNASSMLVDLRRGRPTEIDAINGAVIRMGKKFGVSTPVHTALHILVRTVEEKEAES